MTIGHDHHLGLLALLVGRAREERVELGRVERGAVAGDAQHAVDAFRESTLDAGRHGSRLPEFIFVPEHQHVRERPPRQGALAADHDREVERLARRQRDEHVADHRARELAAQPIGHPRCQARLCAPEALEREDGRGAHLLGRR